jgi:hypothetical protein
MGISEARVARTVDVWPVGRYLARVAALPSCIRLLR